MKSGFIFGAALCVAVFAANGASATPQTLVGTSVPKMGKGVSDSFNIFVNGSLVNGLAIKQSDEAACADPIAPIGACQFTLDGFRVGNILITPKVSISNEVAVFFEPDGSTISDIFLLGCTSDRDALTGKCTGGANWTILTPNPATGFLVDYNGLVTDLAALGMSVGSVGTEVAGGVGTAFPIGKYLSINGNVDHLPIGANFVSRNDVPEPLTVSLFGAGLAGLFGLRRRRKNAA